MKKTHIIVIIIVIMVILLPNTIANDYSTNINKKIGGNKSDYTISIIETNEKNFFLLGTTYSYGAGKSDIYLIKIDDNGNEIWEKTYGDTFEEGGNSIIKTTDNNYIISGYKKINIIDQHIWVLKINVNGEEIWNKTYGKFKNRDITNIAYSTDGEINEAYNIVETSDGFLIIGRTNNQGFNDELWLIKINQNGEEVWNKTYSSKYKYCHSAVKTDDDSFVIIGSRIQDDKNSLMLLKIDQNGNELWNKTYGSSNSDKKSIIKDNDTYVFSGKYQDKEDDIFSEFYSRLIKTDSNGNMIWNKTFEKNTINLVKKFDNNYVLLGDAPILNQGWISYVDKNGSILCNMTVNITGSGFKTFFDAIKNDENIFITGAVETDTGYFDAWFLKIGSDEFSFNSEAVYIMLFFGMILSLLFIAPIAYYWRKKYFSK